MLCKQLLTCSNIKFCFLEPSGISVLIFSAPQLVESPDAKPETTEVKQLCWWEWFLFTTVFQSSPKGGCVME